MSALPKTAERVALELLAGTRLILQRVPRGASAEAFADALSALTGRSVERVQEPTPAEGHLRLLDARGRTPEQVAGWDAVRAEVATADAPLVVLVDVLAADSLQAAAPHFVSWAGGARLPVDPGVRPARSEAEVQLGESWLRRILAADPTLAARHAGQTVAIDLFSGRVFVPRPDALALDQAQERLDEGVVYVVRVAP